MYPPLMQRQLLQKKWLKLKRFFSITEKKQTKLVSQLVLQVK